MVEIVIGGGLGREESRGDVEDLFRRERVEEEAVEDAFFSD
jgi:hypothetical protein